MKAGLEVVVRGSLDLWAPQGKFQIKASSIEPVGAGALQLAFEQLKKKLAAEGLFEPARSPIPFLPRRIAIVTSPEGAAIRDILQVLRRRFDGLAVTIYPVRVQGAGAAAEIVAGIRAFNRRGGFDVLIVARGGGSAEDLAAFNDERVARALAASRDSRRSRPSGTRRTGRSADFVADLRAPTPSAAAELVVERKEEARGGASAEADRACRSARWRPGSPRAAGPRALSRARGPARVSAGRSARDGGSASGRAAARSSTLSSGGRPRGGAARAGGSRARRFRPRRRALRASGSRSAGLRRALQARIAADASKRAGAAVHGGGKAGPRVARSRSSRAGYAVACEGWQAVADPVRGRGADRATGSGSACTRARSGRSFAREA